MGVEAVDIKQKYGQWIDYLGLQLYEGKPYEELLLLRWWMHLNESGDINDLINPDGRSLKAFLDIFSPPTMMIYTCAENSEINRVAWCVPFDKTSQHRIAFYAFWIRSGIRKASMSVFFTYIAYALSLEFYDALLGTTWQSSLIDEHLKLGYTVVGCIPKAFDQPFLYMVHLARDDFYSSRFYGVVQRLIQRRK